jgi:hypothetical protein
MISLCNQLIIDLGYNEVGAEGIRWLARAKWSSIRNIDLGKTDQI